MNIASIDIETTGLIPNRCMILSIAVVIDGNDFAGTAVDDLPCLELLIDNGDLLTGQEMAFVMNAGLLERIDQARKYLLGNLYTPARAMDRLVEFISTYLDKGKITPAGKNFGSFDRQFIAAWGGDALLRLMHHRSIDPGTLYATPNMRCPPSTEDCHAIMLSDMPGGDDRVRLQRAWSRHDALSDARNVLRLIRHKWKSGLL